MRSVSILAWQDNGGVTKIHNIITKNSNIKWETHYINRKGIIVVFFILCKILSNGPVCRILVGNGREALLVYFMTLFTLRKASIVYIQHTPIYNKKIIFRVIFNLICLKFSVVTISNELRENLNKNLFKKARRFQLIYNPVLHNEKTELTVSELTTSVSFIAVGRLTYQKNYEFMIEFIKHLNDNGYNASLEIFGDGEDRAKIETLIQLLNLNEKVKLMGYSDDIDAMLRNADVYIMTSLWEGLPTSLIEAMSACGRIIAYKCPTGVEEIMSNQPATSLVHKLCFEQFEKSLRSLLGIKGIVKRDLINYNIKENIKKYEEIFNVSK